MATADDYAKWIVANKDKQGTKEFAIVARAYEEAKKEEEQQAQQAQGRQSSMSRPEAKQEIDPALAKNLAQSINNMQPGGPIPSDLRSAALNNKPPAQQPQMLQSPPVKEIPFGQGLLGLAETGLTMGTGALSSAFGGLAGLATLPFSDLRGATNLIRTIQEAGTYQPRTEGGKEILGAISKPFQALEEGQKMVGDVVQEKTGSPFLGVMAESAPDIVGALFGLPALRGLKGGTLLKENGEATRALKDALNKHGIVYEQLSPQVQQAIPNYASRNLIVGSESIPKTVENALVEEIKAGGRQKGLAPYRETSRGNLGKDPLAEAVIKQEFPAGDVQMVKTATPETQAKMLEMLRNREAISANSALDIQLRPSNVVGDAVAQRLKFIAEKSNSARNELNNIARQSLKGKPFDPAPIENVFRSNLDDLGVKMSMVDGKPKMDFRGSIIQEDKSAQRVLQQLVNLMSDTTNPVDALRAHNLKRQIDALVDWNKAPQQGLTAVGKNVLKDVRHALNQSLREVDPQYARVNDTISQALSLFDELDNATASKITVAKTLGDSKGMGTELRKLFSNYQSRQDLDTAIRAMDDLAKKFQTSTSREVGFYQGGPRVASQPSFNDSIVDLARFANVLDAKFGASAKTSFQGIQEQAVKHGMRAAQGGVTNAAVSGISEKLMDSARRMRNIDDYNAYRSMEELLKRGAK